MMRLPKLHLSGRFYDWLLEPLLVRIKGFVGGVVSLYGLSPVLDICCGTGTQCHIVSDRGNKIFGLDLSLKAVRYAAWKYPRISFICADATAVPLKPTSLEGVILSFSLHEKPQGMRDAIMKEIKRLLVPEGRIIFVDYENPWSRRSRVGAALVYLIELSAGRVHFRNYRHFMRQGGLRSFVQQHGLVEILRHGFEWGTVAVVVVRWP